MHSLNFAYLVIFANSALYEHTEAFQCMFCCYRYAQTFLFETPFSRVSRKSLLIFFFFHCYCTLSTLIVTGSQSKALGGVKHEASIPQLLMKTFDGFMHISMRSPGVEAIDEQKVIYTVSWKVI